MSIRAHEASLRPLAESAERSNRPTMMIVATVGLLLAASVFSIMSINAARSAGTLVAASRRQATDVVSLAARVEALQRDSTAGQPSELELYRPLRGLLSTVNAAAGQAGLDAGAVRLTSNQPQRPANSPLVRQTINARLSGQSIDKVLQWIESSLAQAPGLYISSFRAQPNQVEGWVITVEFARWELES